MSNCLPIPFYCHLGNINKRFVPSDGIFKSNEQHLQGNNSAKEPAQYIVHILKESLSDSQTDASDSLPNRRTSLVIIFEGPIYMVGKYLS